MQQGDFSEIPRIIYDPASSPDPANRTPFPGNRIPTNRISAVSAKMLPFLPMPELPGIVNNSIAPLGSPRADERTLGFKIDHQFTHESPHQRNVQRHVPPFR